MTKLHRTRKRSRNCCKPRPLLATVAAVAAVLASTTYPGDILVSAFQPAISAMKRNNLSFSLEVNQVTASFHRPFKRIASPHLSNAVRNVDRLSSLKANSPGTETENDETVEQSSTALSMDGGNIFDDSWNIPSWAMLTLPIISGIFPFLLETAKSLPPNSTEQWTVISLLFVSNRVYLYALSGTIVALAALRGANDSSFLGQRIVDLTEELLYRPSLLESKSTNVGIVNAQTLDTDLMDDTVAEKTAEEKPAMIEALRQSGLDTSLDQVTGETQALLLPVLITLSLATSVLLLPLWTGGGGDLSDGSGLNLFSGLFKDQQELLSKIVPQLTQVWNFGLLTMFTRSEVRRLMYEISPKGMLSEKDSSENVVDSSGKDEEHVGLEPLVVIEWASAISITLAAFLWKAWPAQNFVNMALAILVARAIQLDRLTVVLGALSLLTIYDATSVFLVPAAMATDLVTSIDLTNTVDATTTMASTVATSLATDSSHLVASSNAAGSAMGSVAVQKLTSTSFQPGLLTTRIGNDNRLGGSLGLGDAVFPSLLAMLSRRFDLEQMKQRILGEEEKEKAASLFAASMAGYFIGCFACEFAPMISTSGIPALVFIVPSMVLSVFLTATLSGQLEGFLEFAPNMEVQSEE